jgi:CHAT domain-containing protein/predicted negative regulator of RcsB-dependent stress response
MSASERDLFSPDLWLQTALVRGAAAVSAESIPDDQRTQMLERLVVEIAQEVFADSAKAGKLAEACDALAALIGGDEAEGKAVRVRGHMQFARNRHEQAVALYERAIELFQAAGSRVEEARTMSSGLQSLIYLGRYQQAEAWSEKAQQVFEQEHDMLRLARLHSNRGNILYRQDRYQEALSSYELAREELERIGDARDVASVITNMATVQISMGRFEDALQAYREARRRCEEAGLSRMAAAADYNIAYLYYLRGDYLRAIDIYRHTRLLCSELADPYHEALCDLDEAEMYLELNLSREGARLARRAAAQFMALGMNYERAKAMVSEAVSLHHVGAGSTGRALLRQAREILSQESNRLWPSLIDLYLAISYLSEDQTAMAGRLANKASTHLSKGGLAGKSALCDLVRARVRLRSGKVLEARALCQDVLNLPPEERLPSIDYLAWFTLGEVEEHQGHWMAAWDAWQKTREAVDRLRNSLGGEDLRISFLKDKVEVYENLIWLWMSRLAGTGEGPAPRSVLDLLQEAKSRSLADLLDTTSGEGLKQTGDLTLELRAVLASLYRRIESAMLSSNTSETEVRHLTRQAREAEDTLAERLSEQRRAQASSPRERRAASHGAYVSGTHDVQRALPKNSQLVEFFAVRGKYVAAVVSQRRIEFVELGPVSVVAEKVRLARFQLSKFRLGKEYVERFAPRLRDAIQTHLRGLYEDLLRPLRRKLREEHLVIAPYGILHQLPFHALHDGERCLADEFTVSYTPSGGVLAACLRRPVSQERGNLVFGIADARSPAIENEARRVAELLVDAQLCLGEEATEERLRLAAPHTRILHIATHGFFRRDNPLFSAIRLGDGFLSLFDLYRLDLRADLVTLSGCSTGLSTVVGGDELLGLTRGLLHAGARAVLLSLWDVQDESTADYMATFYQRMSEGQTAATASRDALRSLRSKYEHPYYWAPFCLVGDWNVGTLPPNPA